MHREVNAPATGFIVHKFPLRMVPFFPKILQLEGLIADLRMLRN
jgi:hypothetical protein